MAAMHCLSCEHPNSASAKFCERCGSALNLRLCEKCEAVNAASASRCHSCDAPLAAQRAVRKPRVLAALASVGAAGIVCAAGAFYLLDRAENRSGPFSEKGVTTSFRPTPMPAERTEAVAPAPESAAKAKATAHMVTHTRAVPAVIAPAAPPAALPAAAQPVAPLENEAPPVTHTRRAAATPETKIGSN